MKKILLLLVVMVITIGISGISCKEEQQVAQGTTVEDLNAQPSITLLSPNGGETWEKGDSAAIDNIEHRPMIKWQVNGIFAEDKNFAVMKLKKGNEVIKIIGACPISSPWNKPEHCWMPWSVPQDIEPGNDYKIEIIPVISETSGKWSADMKEVIGGIGDESDNYFSIIETKPSVEELQDQVATLKQQLAQLQAQLATQISITVLSPNGGEQWAVGETRRISWQSSGVKYVRIYIYDDTISGSGSINYIYDGALSYENGCADTGYYDWTIQKGQLPGSTLTFPRNYKIRVDGVNEATLGSTVIVQDWSDDYFGIVEAE